ncbi:MAG TPA: hypothetical protein VNO30_03405 [Kofleriaceae bacterium]|nr:hypothetical protein [Kofleriaceae bacterium]
MKARDASKADLARLIAVSSTAISDLLGPEVESSRLVPRVHRALNLPPPAPPASDGKIETDALLHELIEIWPTLDNEDRRILISIARRANSRTHER